MTPAQRTLVSLVAATALLIQGVPVTQAATIGTLTQLASPSGCVTDASAPLTGCDNGRALLGTAPFFGSHAVTLSPDGKNLYAVSFNSDAVTVFDREPSSGKLTQKAGTAGCVADGVLAGCATGKAMSKPTSIAASPDGKSVYVASIVGGSVAVLDRNLSTGALVQKSGVAGCLANARSDCAAGRALDGADAVAVSPDGLSVYVGTFKSNGVAVFDRSRSSGALRQKAGPDGCIVETASPGCRTGRALEGAEGLTISPDGKSVYVGAAVGNAVAVFRRNRATGRLFQLAGSAGCVAFQGSSGCASGDGLVGADSMQVSPDNKNLYVASGVGDSVAAFDRSRRTGRLTQLAGTAGCYTNHERNLGRCVSGVQLDGPEGIAVSPDGNSVYVGAFNSNAVTVFDRVSFTGTITQRSGANGCIVNVATTGCTTGNALGNANALAISPYGGNVYVGAYAGNAIDAFARAQPRNGRVAAHVPSRLRMAPRTVASVPVTCSGSRNRRCAGGLTLRASSQRGATASLRTIGRGWFNIPRGRRERVSVALSAIARHYLNDNGSLPVVATLRVVQPSGRTEVFRERIVLSKVRKHST